MATHTLLNHLSLNMVRCGFPCQTSTSKYLRIARLNPWNKFNRTQRHLPTSTEVRKRRQRELVIRDQEQEMRTKYVDTKTFVETLDASPPLSTSTEVRKRRQKDHVVIRDQKQEMQTKYVDTKTFVETLDTSPALSLNREEGRRRNDVDNSAVHMADQDKSRSKLHSSRGQRNVGVRLRFLDGRTKLKYFPPDIIKEKIVTIFSPQTKELFDADFLQILPENDPLFQENNPGAVINSVKELMSHEQKLSLQNLPKHYMKLSKIRLTAFVAGSEIAGYMLASGFGQFNYPVFAMATIGTGLLSCSANAINQFLEVPYDSQMNRTKNRVLVRGMLSPVHAVSFAVVAGSVGMIMLFFVNPLTAGLGALNLFLYTMVYTPMKRRSILNTWVGSVVGAIPPMMGVTAVTGTLLDPTALWVGALLYTWQFPHFNALSWNLRVDYSRAGYRMTSVVNPKMCKNVALRHSAYLTLLCIAAPVLDITSWTFIYSLPLNLVLCYRAFQFRIHGDSGSSRKLFRYTLIHLPALIIIMLISRKSQTEQRRKENQSLLSYAQEYLSDIGALMTS